MAVLKHGNGRPTSPQTVPSVLAIFCQLTLFVRGFEEKEEEGGGGGGRGIPPGPTTGVGGGGGTVPGVVQVVMSLVGVVMGVVSPKPLFSGVPFSRAVRVWPTEGEINISPTD